MDGRTHNTADLKQFHQACIYAARADYCGGGVSFTQNGTAIDMYDAFGLNKKVLESAPRVASDDYAGFTYESSFDEEGLVQMSQMRYDEMSGYVVVDEQNGVYVVLDECVPEWLVVQQIECINGVCIDPDAGPSASQRTTWYNEDIRRLKVETSTYCAHDVCEAGDDLDRGCNNCTREVCDEDPYCCNNSWDSICVAQVNTYCSTTQDCE
jgi:hypothetical protein